MLKRVLTIAAIFGCCSAAWIVLATSIAARTSETANKLGPGVASTWGAVQEQFQPAASIEDQSPGAQPIPLDAERTRVHATLALEYRRKGLLWYSTYVVRFTGVYTFRNPADQPRRVALNFPFPAQEAIYDGLAISANGQPLPFSASKDGAAAWTGVPAGQAVEFRVAYASRGLDSWRYNFGKDVQQTRDFELTLNTNFRQIDFPANTLSPTTEQTTAAGWELTWRYRNLISGFQIGMTMPQKTQPGPLAAEISAFAPVSLLLFFFVLLILTALRKVDLHPVNYGFLAAAFFAFHLLLAYLADHLAIQWAFAVSSLVSVGLVVSYLRLVVGPRFAIAEAGLAQFVYLVLFSCSFFLKGFTGLTITIGCIATLFVTMQVTARVRWRDL